MKTIYISFSFIFFFTTLTSAQELSFASMEMEAGIRYRLKIDDSEPLTSQMLTEITEIDLSSMGITDISDIAYMTNLRHLDLHDNEISDVTPLLALDSLNYVDLNHNKLLSIFPLSFSHAKKMEVDVAFNYISDFSCFATLTPCQFTIEGTGLQTIKDAPYFLVRYLYSDGTAEIPAVYYRVDATTNQPAELEVNGVREVVHTDNEPHVSQLNGGFYEAYPVMVTDGTFADSAYLVAQKTMHVDPGQTINIETGLPDNYEIRYSEAQNGSLSSNGVNFTYKASSKFDHEEIIYTFYRGGMLRGVSKLVLTQEPVIDGIPVPKQGAGMDIALHGNVLNVTFLSELLSNKSIIEVCDISGQVITSRCVDSGQGINEQIPLSYYPHDIIIIKIKSGKKQFANKLIIKR